MRNTAEYPVTNEEKLATLQHCAKLLDVDNGERIGGIMPYALQLIIEEFESRCGLITLENTDDRRPGAGRVGRP